jgi:hypothetical protein
VQIGNSSMRGRHLIFVPEINPSSFVFFYVMDDRSYSIREYLNPPVEKVRYAAEFPYTASEICRMANRPGNHFFEGMRHNTKDFRFWQETVMSLNSRFLGNDRVEMPTCQDFAARVTAVQSRYPLMNQDELMRLPKAAKRQDLERILQSKNSEDYVTWNVFQLLQVYGNDWWRAWHALACAKNPLVAEELQAEARPEVKLWQTVQTPPAYEQASRRRMAASLNPEWVRRAADSSAVEGLSEIDIVLTGKHYVIYVEAKLGSDISTRTTYDPDRNQVVRNIDCLLESASGRTPFFWMITRDDAPSRSYTQVMGAYKTDVALLASALPHRKREVLEGVANRMTVFLWRELLGFVRRPDDPDLQRILNEVSSRI